MPFPFASDELNRNVTEAIFRAEAHPSAEAWGKVAEAERAIRDATPADCTEHRIAARGVESALRKAEVCSAGGVD
jgi:hypothetical protein